MQSVVNILTVGLIHLLTVLAIAGYFGYGFIGRPTPAALLWAGLGGFAVAAVPYYFWSAYGTVTPMVLVVGLLLLTIRAEGRPGPSEPISAVYLVFWPLTVAFAGVLTIVETVIFDVVL